MPDPHILSVASRRRIYECVTENPGTHLRETARRCAMPLGTSLYHLDHLEGAGLIVSRRDGRYKRYFGSHSLGRREKEVLSLLRHDAPRRIVESIVARGASTQRELCDAIGVSRSTVSFHLSRLVGEGVVSRRARRPESLYEVAEPALTTELLSRFSRSLTPTAPAPAAERATVESLPAVG